MTWLYFLTLLICFARGLTGALPAEVDSIIGELWKSSISILPINRFCPGYLLWKSNGILHSNRNPNLVKMGARFSVRHDTMKDEKSCTTLDAVSCTPPCISCIRSCIQLNAAFAHESPLLAPDFTLPKLETRHEPPSQNQGDRYEKNIFRPKSRSLTDLKHR